MVDPWYDPRRAPPGATDVAATGYAPAPGGFVDERLGRGRGVDRRPAAAAVALPLRPTRPAGAVAPDGARAPPAHPVARGGDAADHRAVPGVAYYAAPGWPASAAVPPTGPDRWAASRSPQRAMGTSVTGPLSRSLADAVRHATRRHRDWLPDGEELSDAD